MSTLINDELWDYYSGLPNPMWYHHNNNLKESEEEIASNIDDIEVITE